MTENATRLQSLEKENEEVRAKNLELQGKLNLLSNIVQPAPEQILVDNGSREPNEDPEQSTRWWEDQTTKV